jgi:hypothetical protein
MLSICQGLRFSRISKRKPVIWWPENPGCEAGFEDLFEPFRGLEVIENQGEGDERGEVIYKKRRCLRKVKTKNGIFRYIDVDEGAKKMIITGVGTFFHKDELEPFKRSQEYAEDADMEIREYLREFQPKVELKKKIDQFSSEKMTRNTVSIHLRRTDHPAWKNKKGLDNGKVIQQLDQFIKDNPSVDFFLATDSEETEIEIRSAFKEKVFCFPKQNWVTKRDRDKDWARNVCRPRESQKEALIELYLLSRPGRFLRLEEHSGKFDLVASLLNPRQESIFPGLFSP